jgi:hypothetical protein
MQMHVKAPQEETWPAGQAAGAGVGAAAALQAPAALTEYAPGPYSVAHKEGALAQ